MVVEEVWIKQVVRALDLEAIAPKGQSEHVRRHLRLRLQGPRVNPFTRCVQPWLQEDWASFLDGKAPASETARYIRLLAAFQLSLDTPPIPGVWNMPLMGWLRPSPCQHMEEAKKMKEEMEGAKMDAADVLSEPENNPTIRPSNSSPELPSSYASLILCYPFLYFVTCGQSTEATTIAHGRA
ncbi:hypothetical protein L6452_07102 [Arctium lappa]|uniref:Uncharacterized protein n=1 Tax=Arctium lappa TaxID=4217 RepID=A0ACB9EKY9_ARCLA|nr:hypothetical protein L6452_07102 [Arctium lappa]